MDEKKERFDQPKIKSPQLSFIGKNDLFVEKHIINFRKNLFLFCKSVGMGNADSNDHHSRP